MDEREKECRGRNDDDDDDEEDKQEDGCLTDSSFEDINRLTTATTASVEGHNLST